LSKKRAHFAETGRDAPLVCNFAYSGLWPVVRSRPSTSAVQSKRFALRGLL